MTSLQRLHDATMRRVLRPHLIAPTPSIQVAGEIAAAGLPVIPGSICAHFGHDPRLDRICRDCGRRTL